MKKDVLEQIEKDTVVTTSTAHDPKKHFITGDGLYVWSTFKDRILPKAEPTKKGMKYTLSSFDLVKYATDDRIEAELSKKHLFEESDACALIAELIKQQPNGKKGPLVTTGYANLFYTPSCVVRVDWFGGAWDVLAWPRDGYGWFEGGRVFSSQLALGS